MTIEISGWSIGRGTDANVLDLTAGAEQHQLRALGIATVEEKP